MIIKKNIPSLLFFIVIFLVTPMSAQINTQGIQKEIDQTVWKPFKTAFETLDGEAVNKIYAEKVIRVTPQGIDTKSVFKRQNVDRFKQNKKNGDRITLDFWFESRDTNETTSYEVGFYRMGFTSKDGKKRNSYGQFHIVLEKINGKWKITQDWDKTTIAGREIGKSIFEKQQPHEF